MKNIVKIIIIAAIILASIGIYRNHNIKPQADIPKQETKSDETERFKNKPLIYNNCSIPVLMYHSIDYEKGNELRVPVKNFEEQMKFLKENEYTTLSLEELYNFFQNNKPVPSKSVVITFDDGYSDNYLNAYPVLKKYGLKATVFVITSTVDKNKKCLNSSQLKEMQNNGVDIESHTVNHEELNRLSYEKQLDVLKRSKYEIENLLGKKVYYIAYPVGKWDNNTIEAAKNAGYKMAFTTKNSQADKGNGIYTLNRVRINASYGIEQYKKLIEAKN